VASSYDAVINWGDGSPTQGGTVAAVGGTSTFTLTGTHVSNRTGTFNGTVTVHQSDGATLTIRFTGTSVAPTLTIAPIAPTEDVRLVNVVVGTLSAPAGGAGLSSNFYFATIDWGVGSQPDAGLPLVGDNVVGSHTYAESGNYTQRVTVGTFDNPALISQTRVVSVADVPIVLTGDLSPESDSGISNSDKITNLTTPTFTGRSEAGSTVRVVATAQGTGTHFALGTTTTDSSGAWSLTSAVSLPDGRYTVVATAVDRNGVTTATTRLLPGGGASNPLVVDTVGPVVTDLPFNRYGGTLKVNIVDNLSGLDQRSIVDNRNYGITKPHTRAGSFPITSLTASGPDSNGVQTVTAVFRGPNGRRLLAPGTYTIFVRSGGIEDVAGNALDGEFYGYFPSGNRRPGGDFLAVISTIHLFIFPPLPVDGFGSPHNPPGTFGTGFRLLPNAGRFDDPNRLVPIGQAVAQASPRRALALTTLARQVVRQAVSPAPLATHDAALEQLSVPRMSGRRG
jgi:hypothetical protein